MALWRQNSNVDEPGSPLDQDTSITKVHIKKEQSEVDSSFIEGDKNRIGEQPEKQAVSCNGLINELKTEVTGFENNEQNGNESVLFGKADNQLEEKHQVPALVFFNKNEDDEIKPYLIQNVENTEELEKTLHEEVEIKAENKAIEVSIEVPSTVILSNNSCTRSISPNSNHTKTSELNNTSGCVVNVERKRKWVAAVQQKTANKKEKTRARKFTSLETDVLVREIEKQRKLLFGPLSTPNHTRLHRDRAWESVVNAINDISPVGRTVEEIKNKFKDLKSRTKIKANAIYEEIKRTGGVRVDIPELTKTEELILSFVGNDSVTGNKGGTDTLRPTPIISPPQSPIVTKTTTDTYTELTPDSQSVIEHSTDSTDTPQQSTTCHVQPSTSSYYILLPSQINTQDIQTNVNLQSTNINATITEPTQYSNINTIGTNTTNTPEKRSNTKERALQALCQSNEESEKQTILITEIRNLLAEEVQLKKRKLELYENYQKEKILLKKQKLLLLQKK